MPITLNYRDVRSLEEESGCLSAMQLRGCSASGKTSGSAKIRAIKDYPLICYATLLITQTKCASGCTGIFIKSL